ncbi:Rubrerythrin family protein [Trichomonas vaginalis G3]|uniref:Rubrerythrin family protein n=1 Tax=Trichomonas vaginalis (strain ATCC PRA-98 / G3) TaxID=412133 RepID=A2DIF8_TRIV3|nr:rubrerythrin family [Trichomonas vaginalis G3]EAY19762.1 Rubrerythrin family protein [Trichomonas vaginalis G3]KAI5523941.1 rubrerythrin family [Trichomonas vaginalis G3]|eukprot:XP_001580748.1 Rubrerythrin family protein [Trichomonas vaginalis G3]
MTTPAPPPATPPQAPNLKGSRTEKNLAAAFTGECMARNRYYFYASKAKKQGYEQISEIFLETAENEREHAKKFLKLMGTGEATPVTFQMVIPNTQINTTLENLRTAERGEAEENNIAYPHMAAIAEQEGFEEIAKYFRKVAEVEREHRIRFGLLADQLESDTLFKKSKDYKWKCRNCGNIFEGPEPPEKCPVCGHAQSFYQIKEIFE